MSRLTLTGAAVPGSHVEPAVGGVGAELADAVEAPGVGQRQPALEPPIEGQLSVGDGQVLSFGHVPRGDGDVLNVAVAEGRVVLAHHPAVHVGNAGVLKNRPTGEQPGRLGGREKERRNGEDISLEDPRPCALKADFLRPCAA